MDAGAIGWRRWSSGGSCLNALNVGRWMLGDLPTTHPPTTRRSLNALNVGRWMLGPSVDPVQAALAVGLNALNVGRWMLGVDFHDVGTRAA